MQGMVFFRLFLPTHAGSQAVRGMTFDSLRVQPVTLAFNRADLIAACGRLINTAKARNENPSALQRDGFFIFGSQCPKIASQLLHRLLEERILILDGAMGTMIQSHGLDAASTITATASTGTPAIRRATTIC